MGAVHIDQSVTPYGVELGALIVELAREALNQVRGNARDRLDELAADPRIAAVVEALGDAADKPRPARAQKAPEPDDELSEEELIELNQRRNQGFFR